MKNQLKGFKAAFSGIWYSLKSECHVRFHLIAGFYVILFSFFYPLTSAQWAVLLLLIGSILTAELFNTAIETLCNLNKESYDPLIKITKDISAGAVLLLSATAIIVAVVFYADITVIKYIISFFLAQPPLLALLIISIVWSVFFVAIGPMGFSRIYYKFKTKK